ncbi:Scr1 family TA system antitoxin-like transcriptional regulator, partial [Pseudonocardia sp. ICBG1293]
MTSRQNNPWAQLGARLRKFRLTAGMSGRTLADAIGCDQSRVSRIELGKSHVTKQETQEWLRATRAPSDSLAELLAEIDAAPRKSAPQRNSSLNGWQARRGDVESIELEAASILTWHSSFVPDLLQSAAYMRHFFHSTTYSSKRTIAVKIAERIDRQNILYTFPRKMEVVVTECLLRQKFGGTHVMVDQLDRITSLAKRN